MSAKDGRRFALGALIIGAVAYVIGVLTAPKSGKENRETLKEATGLVTRELEKQLKANYSDIQVNIKLAESKIKNKKDVITDELTKAVADANVIQKKIREALSAIHEGNPSNPELDQLIKEAKQVKEHLIKYLAPKDNK